MSYDMKKAFTNCIPCMKSKVPDGIENTSGQNIKKSQENALMEKKNRSQRQIHTIQGLLYLDRRNSQKYLHQTKANF